MAVNAQTNSANRGYNLITKYRSADYICIDEPEFRLAMHDKNSSLEKLLTNTKKITKGKDIHCNYRKEWVFVKNKK